MPQLTSDRPAQGAEGLAIFHALPDPIPRKDGKGYLARRPPWGLRWNGKGSRGIWRHTVDRTPGRHPAQKPWDLVVDLLSKFSDQGNLILDPYCGSGQIGRAALALDRRYIGNDLDPRWATSASRYIHTGAPE